MSSTTELAAAAAAASTASAPASAAAAPSSVTGAGVPSGLKYQKRKKYEHQGRTIYEWEQNIEQVDMWIDPPEGITAKMIDCKITPKHLAIGLKGNPPFIDLDLHGTVVVDESFWMMEDGELHLNFQKAVLAETWPSVFVGHATLTSVEQEQATQQIMLERFQREHPGFDFSQATFTGQTPDPKNFLGGFDTNKIKGK